MKEYTKPTVVKVELTHEQAVLGTCSSTASTPKDGGTPTECYGSGGCKARTLSKGDEGGTS